MALEKQVNALSGKLKLVRPGLLTPHIRSPTTNSDSSAIDPNAGLTTLCNVDHFAKGTKGETGTILPVSGNGFPIAGTELP
ncbi:hypothetical protein [Sphingobium sp. BS19]|uniref:hypothetical protein n=1 Tax=Sphingobium sp. BS19 TaxID=3018973 RepID=UPI0024924200|nr:hypothetical protein [Sphingobium sp. BS19]